MLAIMHALAKFRQYLVGNRFKVKTDHNSLRFLMEQKELSERQHKWISKIQAYDFEIKYVKGKNNVVVDALSRVPSTLSLMEISADWKALLLVEYSKNKFSCEILDGRTQDDRYRVIDDIIYYKDRIYLVPESQLKDKIMHATHNSPLAGHPGYLKTYRKIRERFTWKGLKTDVLRFVRECNICQQNKAKHTHPTDYFNHFPFQNKNGKASLWISSQGCPGAGKGLYLCGS
jgi:hypothetical protein